jgi:DNA-binding IclR family transcriptional regulator
MKHLENLLKQHPWTKSGLARQLHVHRSTIGRYIDEMSELVLIQEDDNGRLSIAN